MPFIGRAKNNHRSSLVKIESKVCINQDCGYAGVLQDISEFYERRQNPDGHAASCKTCDRKKSRDRVRERSNDSKMFLI